jgi:hypothetical protein
MGSRSLGIRLLCVAVFVLCSVAAYAAPTPLPPLTLLVGRGAAPQRWAHFTVEAQPRGARLVGCETATRSLACRRTRQVALGTAARDELGRLWRATQESSVACGVRISMADWLPFELSWRGGQRSGRLPTRFISWMPRCFPHTQLAWWLLQRWDERPASAP